MHVCYDPHTGRAQIFSSFCDQEITANSYVLTVVGVTNSTANVDSYILVEGMAGRGYGSGHQGFVTLRYDISIAMGHFPYKVVESSRLTSTGGVEVIEVQTLVKEGDTAKFRTYRNVTHSDKSRLDEASSRFGHKANMGRYKHSVHGGFAGWISTGIGKRGVNASDFVLKILNESGIANRFQGLTTTANRIAKHRG
jgi:hypothetical protein